MRTRDQFHALIDKIEDEKALTGYFNLIQMLNNNVEGKLWNNLSNDEKQELLLSYEESFDANNLISHESVKQRYNKWLNK